MMRQIIPLQFLVFCLLVLVTEGSGQQLQGANWLFGAGVHLNFNSSQPTVSNFSFTDTTASSVATISDRYGNLLFFSSGGRVGTRQKINGVYQEMPNGVLFSGRLSGPPSVEMIVQSPADSNMYYLFFISRIYDNGQLYDGLFSVQVDMRLNNGYGDVVSGSRKFLKRGVNTMKLTAMMHQNNRDTWVLTQSYYSDSIYAHLITPAGIMAPVETKINQPLNSFSTLKGSPNSNMLAMLGTLGVEVFQFNRTTGVPTHKYSFPSPDPDYWLYSFAFSPDNTKLYAGTAGWSYLPLKTTVYQYDLVAGSATQVNASRNVIFNSTNYGSIGDMQLAADGKIYLSLIEYNPQSGLQKVNPYLSQISCPDFYGQACRFKYKAIYLNGPVKTGVLPALNQTLFRNAGKLQAQATRSVICAGDSVQLSAFGAGAEHFKWAPANGLAITSDTLASPIVKPTQTTTYKVIGRSACRSDTAFVKVTVAPKPGSISVSGPVQVYENVENQEYFVSSPMPGSYYSWQVNGGIITKGQGESSISVTWGSIGNGTVTVVETNAAGCKGEETGLQVKILNGPPPHFYNIITPNADGKNDFFVIENLKWYPENELQLFNRWGTEVYRSTNYQNNWQAQNLSGGIYYYYFRAKGKSWKGWLEVVK